MNYTYSVQSGSPAAQSTSKTELGGASEVFYDDDTVFELQLAKQSSHAAESTRRWRCVQANRISRLYRGDEVCEFDTQLPEGLAGRVDKCNFTRHMDLLNAELKDAHNTTLGLADAVLASFTFQLWPYIMRSHYQRVRRCSQCMARFERHLVEMDQVLLRPYGLCVVNPRECAFMFIEIREV